MEQRLLVKLGCARAADVPAWRGATLDAAKSRAVAVAIAATCWPSARTTVVATSDGRKVHGVAWRGMLRSAKVARWSFSGALQPASRRDG
jgi:hypothetical protein